MSRISKYPLILLQLLILAGCANQGGSAVDTIAAANPGGPIPDGLYIGTISNGYIHNTFVLENGQYYVLYGVSTTPALKVAGFIQGTGTFDNGNLSSTDLKDFFWDGSVFGGMLSASISGSTFKGTLTKRNSTVSLAGAPPAVTFYNYNESPNILDIAGGWTLTSMAGATASMSINSDGTLAGKTGGCAYTGTLNPRASGKNVFDVVLSFGGPPCSLPGQTVSGAAISYLLTDGVTRQFHLAAVNEARSDGTALFGVRSSRR